MPESDETAEGARRSDANNWARPVPTLRAKDVPPDALDLNVTGRRVHGAAGGFGKLWQKTFRVRLEDVTVAPSEVIRIWKHRFSDFWPSRQRMFLPVTGIAPGEVGLINAKAMPGTPRMASGVLVVYADDESFTFMAPEGFAFAGPITFSAFDDAGTTVVQVQELTRASDPLFEIALMLPVLGDRIQNDVWRETLRNLANHWDVYAPVEESLVVVDPHRQWSNAKNIWQNFAIRSTFYAIAAPFRRLGGRR